LRVLSLIVGFESDSVIRFSFVCYHVSENITSYRLKEVFSRRNHPPEAYKDASINGREIFFPEMLVLSDESEY
jgi:hypothetical protein